MSHTKKDGQNPGYHQDHDKARALLDAQMQAEAALANDATGAAETTFADKHPPQGHQGHADRRSGEISRN